MQHGVLLGELLDLHGNGIRQFLAQLAHDFLAHDFGRQEALAAIGNLLLGEEIAGLGEELHYFLLQFGDIVPAQCRDRQDRGEIRLRGQRLQVRQQGRLVLQQVHLVDHQQAWQAALANLLQHHGILFGPGGAVHHHHHHVNIAYGGAGGAIHVAIDRFPGLHVQARGVHENDLVAALGLDTQHPMAGGLGLAGGNTYLLAQQVIEQRGLAHVGPADNGHVAAASVAFNCHLRPTSAAPAWPPPAPPCAGFYPPPLRPGPGD